MPKVLIIEDDVTVRYAFKKLLHGRNYIVKQARSIREATTALKNESFDAVVLDMELVPEGKKAGFRILEKKKNIPLNTSTPVIVISGRVPPQLIKKKVNEEDSIAAILTKPISSEVLLNALDSVCIP